jgi:hypothetical protein
MPFRRSPEQPNLSNAAARRHNNHTPDSRPYDSPGLTPPPRSRSQPRVPPEPVHSSSYMPHDDPTLSIIPPIPISASASSIEPIPLPSSPSASPVRHPSLTAIDEDTLGSSSPSSFLDSSWGYPTHWGWCAFPGVPNVAGQGLYPPGMNEGPWDDSHNSVSQPHGLGFGDNFAIDMGRSAQRSVPRKQRYERPATQILGQGGSDRRFTCPHDNCGKTFSGEWEKMRHIKTIHSPPTISCRECNYKQLRKDLFTEHCKKRHPGRSIDDLMIQL